MTDPAYPEQLAEEIRQHEQALRERLDVSHPMHPDNEQYAGSPRGFLWFQAAADLLRDEPSSPVFTISGTTKIPTGDRREATVAWDGTGVSGDGPLCVEIELRVDSGETVKATPTGPAVTASLARERDAAITCASVFESYRLDGAPDPAGDHPPDAVVF